MSSLRGSYELPDNGVSTPKHVGAFDRHHNKVTILIHLFVFYKDVYQNARPNHQDRKVLLKRKIILYYTTQRIFFYNRNVVLSE
jgi:hypothetical protein